MLILFSALAQATAPDPPVLVSPKDQGEEAVPARLRVLASDPDGDALTVRFFGRPTQPPGEDFSLVAMPDTQYYACGCNGGSTDTFALQTQWIADHAATENIAFVAQLGDCTEHGDLYEAEWRVADDAFSRLEVEGALVPYGVAVGNHDQQPWGTATGTTTFYNQYFGEDRFTGRDWYGGHYGVNNDNHYNLFEAGGVGFVAVFMEFDQHPDTEVLDWADAVISAYPERQAIVVSHSLLDSDGEYTTQGFDTFVALQHNPNLFLMLCGHIHAEAMRVEAADDGHLITTLLSDYQSRTNGGDGWLRHMVFSPEAGTLEVRTYSPRLDLFEEDEDSAMTLDWDPWLTAWTALGTAEVASGTIAELSWDGIDIPSGYTWYVEVSDGVDRVESEPWTFTTSAGEDTGAEDTGKPDTDQAPDDSAVDSGEDAPSDTDAGPVGEDRAGCGCAAGSRRAATGLGPLLLALALRRRLAPATARQP